MPPSLELDSEEDGLGVPGTFPSVGLLLVVGVDWRVGGDSPFAGNPSSKVNVFSWEPPSSPAQNKIQCYSHII